MTQRRMLSLFIVGVMVYSIVVLATYQAFTKPFPGHNDFLSRWEGARSFWQEGLNPYGDEASLNIQERIYGRAAGATEDPGFFAYPFYTVFLLLPIVYTSYAWASAIWMVLLEAFLIAALILLLDVFRWRPAPLLLGALLLMTLLSYFPARGLILGQPGLFVYFLEVLALWALARRYDRLAGVALVVSTIKPQMGYLLVPLLLLWGLRERRWQFVGSFVLLFAVFMLASFAFLPPWMSDWLGQVSQYTSYTQIGGPVWVIANGPWLTIDPDSGLWFVDGGYGGIIEFVLVGSLYLYMLWTWVALLVQRRSERFLWTVVMTLTITHLVAPRTATPHYVVFFIPLLFYLRLLTTRFFRRRGTLYALLILAALFVQQWAHFLLTVDGVFEHPTIYPVTAIPVFVLLLLTRRWWWNDERNRFAQRDKQKEGA